MHTNTPSTERNEKPRRGERRGSVGERPRMFIAALPRPSEISARQSHHLSPEGFEPIRRQLGVAHRVLDVEEAFVVAQKSQVEILIVVTETASRVPELGCCGGNPLFRIPQTWLRFGGAFCLTAAATCPALGAAAGLRDINSVSRGAHACLAERAADPLHGAGIDAEAFGNDAHAGAVRSR